MGMDAESASEAVRAYEKSIVESLSEDQRQAYENLRQSAAEHVGAVAGEASVEPGGAEIDSRIQTIPFTGMPDYMLWLTRVLDNPFTRPVLEAADAILTPCADAVRNQKAGICGPPGQIYRKR